MEAKKLNSPLNSLIVSLRFTLQMSREPGESSANDQQGDKIPAEVVDFAVTMRARVHFEGG